MVQKNCIVKTALVVCGPTGSGKTKLSIDLAKAFDGEIISADSVAIYKGLNIGSAKPTEKERSEVVHHMIDVVSPTEEFSVAEYKELSRKILSDVIKRGKTPVICGGTGYYIDALLYDFSYGNCPKNEEFRLKCEKTIEEQGVLSLHERLSSVDKETADILHPNDVMRIVRALEIYETTGKKKSEITDEKTPVVPFFAFSYDYEREVLYERIEKRVDKMFADGLIDEVNGLLDSGVTADMQSMQAIGYKEVVSGLNEKLSEEQIKETVKRNTRRYAKRQITWFKKTDNLVFLSPYIDAVSFIKEYLNGQKPN